MHLHHHITSHITDSQKLYKTLKPAARSLHAARVVAAPAAMASRIPMTSAIECLLDDMQRLAEDQDTADIVFLLGRDEERVYAHRIILMVRCKSFQPQQTPAAPPPIGSATATAAAAPSGSSSVNGGGSKRSSFSGSTSGTELCRIPGCSVSPPPAPGAPTPIRLAHFQADVFRQFVLYVYTGKVSVLSCIFCSICFKCLHSFFIIIFCTDHDAGLARLRDDDAGSGSGRR